MLLIPIRPFPGLSHSNRASDVALITIYLINEAPLSMHLVSSQATGGQSTGLPSPPRLPPPPRPISSAAVGFCANEHYNVVSFPSYRFF